MALSCIQSQIPFLLITNYTDISVEKKRRLSQIELTKMALKKVESDSEEERVRV